MAEQLKAYKMRVGYHNHTTDFNRIDGEYWWNRFADQTSKDVILQFDTGNASEMEGVTPQSLITAQRGPHDLDARQAVFEEGPERVPRRGRARLAGDHDGRRDRGGIEWYIIEYEREGVPPLESLKANLEEFKKLRS